MPIRTAVFPVAGLGTRFLPMTRACPKEMLPIVDKPLLQYAVEEAVAAGIEQLIFIIRQGKEMLLNHLHAAQSADNPTTEQALLPQQVECCFVHQSAPLGLGHALLSAQNLIGDAGFAVLLADDVIATGAGQPGCLAQMQALYSAERSALVAVEQVADERLSQYGIVDPEAVPGRDDCYRLRAIVEKPQRHMAPSNWGIVGRYLLPSSIFSVLQETAPGAGGEIQLTDALSTLLQQQDVYAYPFRGQRYDCGDKLGYMQAVFDHGLADPILGPSLRRHIAKWRQP